MIFAIPIVVVFLIIFFTFVPVGLWITSRFSGVYISMGRLVAMRFRKVNPNIIVSALIKSHQAGIELNADDLESHYLSGGDIDQVVNALIAAERANLDLDFQKAAAINLAGRDVLDAVQVSVTPKIINTPDIAAVAGDGVEVKAVAKVTVRANINKLVGGAGDDTIIARIGEGIVTTIGSAENHKTVLENPDLISETVIKKGLDEDTAYEILSIDIADVDVGRNVGAQLQREQAEADKNIAQAKAEERRSQALALEQENKAKVVAAQAEVPKAMAEALRNGNLSVMDYYNLQNLKADTDMRNSINMKED